jgi:hypothetical protein
MYHIVYYASEPYFRVEFCPKKLLEQPKSQQNFTISQSNVQVKGQWDRFGEFQATETMKRRVGQAKRLRSPPELFVKVNYEIILEVPE